MQLCLAELLSGLRVRTLQTQRVSGLLPTPPPPPGSPLLHDPPNLKLMSSCPTLLSTRLTCLAHLLRTCRPLTRLERIKVWLACVGDAAPRHQFPRMVPKARDERCWESADYRRESRDTMALVPLAPPTSLTSLSHTDPPPPPTPCISRETKGDEGVYRAEGLDTQGLACKPHPPISFVRTHARTSHTDPAPPVSLAHGPTREPSSRPSTHEPSSRPSRSHTDHARPVSLAHGPTREPSSRPSTREPSSRPSRSHTDHACPVSLAHGPTREPSSRPSHSRTDPPPTPSRSRTNPPATRFARARTHTRALLSPVSFAHGPPPAPFRARTDPRPPISLANRPTREPSSRPSRSHMDPAPPVSRTHGPPPAPSRSRAHTRTPRHPFRVAHIPPSRWHTEPYHPARTQGPCAEPLL
ncbi:hypothetical protein C8R44DRAFT_867468 [Mycena epipterygia]|nr:hypothetical protein C8R44DRAFT_867468 [Mycena epipterygia]